MTDDAMRLLSALGDGDLGAHEGRAEIFEKGGSAMMYQCESCHAIIYEPRAVTRRENLDGESGIEERTELYCPACGADETYFEELLEETEDGTEDTD